LPNVVRPGCEETFPLNALSFYYCEVGNVGSDSADLHSEALIFHPALRGFQRAVPSLQKVAQSSGFAVASFQRALFCSRIAEPEG